MTLGANAIALPCIRSRCVVSRRDGVRRRAPHHGNQFWEREGKHAKHALTGRQGVVGWRARLGFLRERQCRVDMAGSGDPVEAWQALVASLGEAGRRIAEAELSESPAAPLMVLPKLSVLPVEPSCTTRQLPL